MSIEQNVEKVERLEKELTSHTAKRRIISGILFLAFLIIGIVFTSLRESTKEVIIYGEGIFSYETVIYNDYYAIGILIGFLSAFIIGVLLFTDILFCRFETTEANSHYITVYKGMSKCIVYVNGEEKGCIGLVSFSNVIDTALPDGTKICVAFSRSVFMIAHISFSDNNRPIDL